MTRRLMRPAAGVRTRSDDCPQLWLEPAVQAQALSGNPNEAAISWAGRGFENR
jgi:hypothetical protein